jgi:hypothetical protein
MRRDDLQQQLGASRANPIIEQTLDIHHQIRRDADCYLPLEQAALTKL